VMASRTLTWAWQYYAQPHGDNGRRGQGGEG
jgi:hypothetical protein